MILVFGSSGGEKRRMEAMTAAVLQRSNSPTTVEDGSKASGKEEPTKEPENTPVPTGLSALLSAVTLQLNESYEQESSSKVPQSSSAARVVSSGGDSLQKRVTYASDGGVITDTAKSTPTMVPEVAKQMPLPESLMTLLMDENNADILTFLPDGKFFAIRTHEFSTSLLKQYFSVETFESFRKELEESGFANIETDQPGIEVFRHRLFNKGDWKGCELLLGELEKRNKESLSPNTSVPASGSLNDHSLNRPETFKRRLSPAHAQRVNSESQSFSQKAKIQNEASSSGGSPEAGFINGPPDPVRMLRNVSDEDYHSAARAITVEKIICNGQGHSPTAKQPVPLEQQAVVGTTRTIVTEAIESLLRDGDHTKETFNKHERALSQSSLPGMVPISKQLFDSKQTGSIKDNGGKSSANGGSSSKQKKEDC
jgi:hypothetical protein